MLYSVPKSIYVVCLLIVLLSIGTVVPKNAVLTPPLSGTKYIGTGTNAQDYATLTAAFADITTNTLGGNVVLVLQSGYNSASETFPITTPVVAATGTYSVTIYPAADGLAIRGSDLISIIDLNGCQNIIIDGRINATGSTKSLIIENTRTFGSTVRYANDASNNLIKFCKIMGADTAQANGIITFYQTTGVTGNDNNTIDNCDISPGPGASVSYGIYAAGTLNKSNSGNIISNCRVYDVFSKYGSSGAILLGPNNSQWTVVGNHIYQTVPRTGLATQYFGIEVLGSSTNCDVFNNFIGGGQDSCGGTPFTITGFANSQYIGIYVASTTGTNSIQGNTIKNFVHSTSNGNASGFGSWCGIYLNNTIANVGTITGNSIGSINGNGSVQLTTSTSGGSIIGISVNNTLTVANIANNKIGSLTSSGSTTSVSSHIFGVYSSNAASLTINNNFIGSASTPNSLWASTAGIGTVGQAVYGILHSGVQTTLSITNNTIANLRNSYASSGTTSFVPVVRGIAVTGAVGSTITPLFCLPTVTGNTIYNLVNEAPYTGAGSLSAVLAILVTLDEQSTKGVSVSQNNIYSLQAISATSAVNVAGISYLNNNTSISLQHSIQKNNIHSLVTLGTSPAALRGLIINSGVSLSIQNNFIRLGVDTSGASLSGDYDIIGISDLSSIANYYHNSIYIGGSGVSGITSTYALSSLTTSNFRSFVNNIFVNSRSNGTGTGSHYAITVGGNSPYPAGLTMNNNIYYTPGTGGKMGRYNGADCITLSSWQTVTGLDAPSVNANPGFVNPSGSASSGNLHLLGSTPAEGSGVNIGVTDDYEGQTRSSLTPVDIGADAGNFTVNDLMPPAFSFNSFLNTSLTSSRTISVTITDNGTGVPVSGVLVPRIWYRRVTPTASSWGSTAGTLSSGNLKVGVWSFVINYSAISITPAAGDSIQYYFVAQDLTGTPNLGFNTPGGAIHTSVNTQSVAPSAPLAYKIVAGLPTNISVGAGQTYTSLTGSSGLFNAVNTSALSGNTTVNITGDLSEDGTTALTGSGLAGYTLTIQPNTTTIRVISNSTNLSQSMIRLNGVTGVVFDGRSGGSGQYLRIINTHSTTPGSCKSALEVLGSTSNTTLRNLIVETNSTTATVSSVLIGSGVNKGILITNCEVRNAQGTPGTAGIPASLLLSNSAYNVVSVISNNFYNFTSAAISLKLVGDSCAVTGNSVYYSSATVPTTSQACISILTGAGHTISDNFLGGKSANCGGTAWVNSGSNINFYGIQLSVADGAFTSVQNNTIRNLSFTGLGTVRFYAMDLVTGNLNIGTLSGNTIGHPTTANSIISSGGTTTSTFGTVTGIQSASKDTINIMNNTISNLTASSTNNNAYIVGINGLGNGIFTVQNNTVYSLSTPTTTNAVVPAGIFISNSSAQINVIGNTVYNLSNTNTGSVGGYINGISVTNSLSAVLVSKNRVYNLTHKASNSPRICALAVSAVSAQIYNNQLSLSNGSNFNNAQLFGLAIYDYYQTNNHKIYFNSVYVFGTSGGSTAISYCLENSGYGYPVIKNNVFYNNRSTGVSGNIIYKMMNVQLGSACDYNLYVCRDTTKFNYDNGVMKSYSLWKSNSASDANSNVYFTTDIIDTNLFVSPSVANLKVDTLKSEKNFLNNKGTPVSGVTTDFYGVTRSIYTPDLGADEFSPALYFNPFLRLKALLEGSYNTGANTMVSDTVKVYLRRTTSPFTVVDSSSVLLSSAGQGVYSFTKTIRDSSFYLQLYNKRALETWSKTGVTFNADTVNYDFTTAANKAYGDNQVLRGTKYCLYSGDVNQDGVIDFSDLIQIDNDNANFVTGDSSSDLNGDGVVDLTDLLIADNNNANFIARITPLSSKRVINPRPVKVLQQ